MTNKEDLRKLRDAFLTIKQGWLEDFSVKLTEWQKNVFDSLEKDLEKLERYENNMPQLIEGHEKLQSSEDWGNIADSAFLIRTALEKMGVIEED